MTNAGFTSLRSLRARTLLPTHRYTAVHAFGVENPSRGGGGTSRMLACVHACGVCCSVVVAALLFVLTEINFHLSAIEHKLSLVLCRFLAAQIISVLELPYS